MTTPKDPLFPADVVVVGDSTVLPDVFRPVAAVVAGGDVRWLTWPSAPLPDRAIEEAEVWATPTGAWVVYRSDEIDESTQRTAVHVRPAGVTAAVDLETRRPIGADDLGLWLGDPRDASEWMDRSGRADDEADDLAEGDDLDPERLPWVPDIAFWPDRDGWVEPVARERGDDEDADADGDDPDDSGDPDGEWTIVFAGDDGSAGVDGSGSMAEVEPRPEPGLPSPTPPTDLDLVRPDGTRKTIRVDRLVESVRSEGSWLVVRYFPTGPRRVPDEHHGWGIVYEAREVRVDVSGGLPESIETEAMASQPAPEDEDDWEQEVERLEAARAPWIDRVDLDLAGVEDAHWPLWSAGTVAQERSVARLRAQFESLDEPSITWSRDHPEPRRIRSAYRDVEVTVEGQWPVAEVVVSFEHAEVPFLRLRRRYRVFDDSGRPIEWAYVTVHLEEDIASGHIPHRSGAVDGVLDI